MTDRSLPNLMPTTDRTLFERTVMQSVAVNQPPPSQEYRTGRATTFDALIPLVESHLFAQGVQRRLLVVFTDGESSRISPVLRLTLRGGSTSSSVSGGRASASSGRRSIGCVADREHASARRRVKLTGQADPYDEQDFAAFSRAARDAVGHASARTRGRVRTIALAPWVVLGGLLPLGYLLWRRNA